jgi:hypothetical protein
MDVDIADSFAVQAVALDEHQHLIGAGYHGGWQILQQFQDRLALSQVAAGEFSDDKRMHHDNRPLEQIDEPRVAAAEVIDPDCGVDQDQAGFPMRRRGMAWIEGCDAPSRASRLALSRSMSAFRPSLKRAVLSIGPVSLTAFASNSSSMLTVVRMASSHGRRQES